ncbi:MAG: Ig-like domain-containing protein [Gemmatimonadota bacterium]
MRLELATVVRRVGESGQLRAQVQGHKGGTLSSVQMVWQSSDPNIAQVNGEGIVTGGRFVTARIAATAGGRRATVAVEVKAASAISAPRLRVGE